MSYGSGRGHQQATGRWRNLAQQHQQCLQDWIREPIARRSELDDSRGAENIRLVNRERHTTVAFRPFDIVYNDDGHGTLVRVIEDLQQHGAAL